MISLKVILTNSLESIVLYFKFNAVRGHQILYCCQRLGAQTPAAVITYKVKLNPPLRNPGYRPDTDNITFSI